jgi:rhodanese-related sulfurtransferase
MFSFFRSNQANQMSTDELKARLARGEKPVMIDVRTKEEFKAGHIPGARLMPLDQLPQLAKSLNPEDELILVCRSGNRSMQAYRYLERLGFKKLQNLDGGMLDWAGTIVRGA